MSDLPPGFIAALTEALRSRADATATREQRVPDPRRPEVNPFLVGQMGISQGLIDSLAAIPVSRSGMGREGSVVRVDTLAGNDRLLIDERGGVGEVLGRFSQEDESVRLTPGKSMFTGAISPEDRERDLIHEFGHRILGPFEAQANVFIDEFVGASGRPPSLNPRHQSNVPPDNKMRKDVRDAIQEGLERLTEDQRRQKTLRDIISGR